MPSRDSSAKPTSRATASSVRRLTKSGSTKCSPTTSRPSGFRIRRSSLSAARASGSSPSTSIRYTPSKLDAGYGSVRPSASVASRFADTRPGRPPRQMIEHHRLHVEDAERPGRRQRRGHWQGVHAGAWAELEDALARTRREQAYQVRRVQQVPRQEQAPPEESRHRAVMPAAERVRPPVERDRQRHPTNRGQPTALDGHGDREYGGGEPGEESPVLRSHRLQSLRTAGRTSQPNGRRSAGLRQDSPRDVVQRDRRERRA